MKVVLWQMQKESFLMTKHNLHMKEMEQVCKDMFVARITNSKDY